MFDSAVLDALATSIREVTDSLALEAIFDSETGQFLTEIEATYRTGTLDGMEMVASWLEAGAPVA